tara:strand:+ start:1931 stop:2278 length:348 start_codon:yes stop_codon:yes gene_type:complete
MAAGTYNITIDKGSDFSFTVTLADSGGSAINISGYAFKAEIRRKPETKLEKAFTISITNGSGGVLKMALTDGDTRDLPVGKLRYDLVGKDGSNNIERYLTGTVTVNDTVTSTEGL